MKTWSIHLHKTYLISVKFQILLFKCKLWLYIYALKSFFLLKIKSISVYLTAFAQSLFQLNVSLLQMHFIILTKFSFSVNSIQKYHKTESDTASENNKEPFEIPNNKQVYNVNSTKKEQILRKNYQISGRWTVLKARMELTSQNRDLH